jgi:DNA-binding YbaB/EbfC family protein
MKQQPRVGDLLKQAQQMRKAVDRVQEELAQRFIEASSGGDRVTVTFNGQQKLVKLSIHPDSLAPDASGAVDRELLEDLIIAAVNQGLEESKKLMNDEINEATGGLANGLGFGG